MVRLNLRIHYSLTAIALLTLTASHMAAAMSYYELEQYEEHIQSTEKVRGNAPEEVRAYLRSSSGDSRVFTLAAGTGSFSFNEISTEPTIDPCSDYSKGQFMSQLKKCAALNLQSAIHRLEETMEGIGGFLQGSSEIHEGADTIGKQQRALAASSVAWEDYRDNTCQLVYLQYFGGSFAGIHKMDCLTQLTEDRIKQLDRIYSGWVDE